jgi:hypothetical protein
MSPTARTLERLRKTGFTACVVEKFNSFTKRRIDAFGFADILAASEGVGIILIQATGGDGGNHANRKAKIIQEPRALQWLFAGGRIEVWSWAKRGARGEPKRWELRREWLKPFVAGFYAKKYEGRLITRDEAIRRLDELLAYEFLGGKRIA